MKLTPGHLYLVVLCFISAFKNQNDKNAIILISKVYMKLLSNLVHVYMVISNVHKDIHRP